MTDRDSFFETLGARLTEEPSTSADREFWTRFDYEFNRSEKSQSRGFLPRRPWIAASLTAGVLLVSLAILQQQQQTRKEMLAKSELLGNTEFLETVEMLEILDRAAIEATEQDWEAVHASS